MRLNLISIFCLINTICIGQSAEFNLKKYWFYRERFNNFFISVGTNSGESLPFPARSTTINCDGIDFQNCMKTNDLPDHLGWYLGVLATEYKLFKDNGMTTNLSTLKYEIYCALYAINRLDKTEAHIGNSDLDGFYIREDFPTDFFQTHPSLVEAFGNQNNEWNINKNVTHNGFINECFSDDETFSSWNQQAMSMDHNTRLLMGLALLVKFLDNADFAYTPNGQVGVFQDGTSFLRDEAKNITDRIMNYMKNPDGTWIIYMPNYAAAFANLDATSTAWNCALGSQYYYGYFTEPCRSCPIEPPYRILIPRGCAPFEYCHGLAEAGNAIRANFASNPANYYNNTLTLGNIPIWNDFAQITPLNGGNLVQVLILAAIGNSWEGIFNGEGTQHAIYRKDKNHQKWGFYHLLNAVLWNEQLINETDGDYALHRLNSAPCNAPDGGHYEWFDNNSLESDTWEKTGPYPSEKLNGLDYMLLFNMYLLSHPDYIDHYENFLNGNFHITGNIPYTAVEELPIGYKVNIIGVDNYYPNVFLQGSPMHLRTFGTITSDAVIENKAFDEDISAPLFNSVYTGLGGNILNFVIDWANNTLPSNYTTLTIHLSTSTLQSNVEFKAANAVILQPGFHAKLGSKFHAIAIPPYCNSSGSGYEKIASGGENNTGSANSTASRKVATKPVSDTKEETFLKKKDSEEIAKDQSIPKDFNILPNPNNGQFTLLLPAKQGLVSRLKIINMMGETVYEITTTSNKVDVSLEYLSSGVYTINLATESGAQTRKMVIH